MRKEEAHDEDEETVHGCEDEHIAEVNNRKTTDKENKGETLGIKKGPLRRRGGS